MPGREAATLTTTTRRRRWEERKNRNKLWGLRKSRKWGFDEWWDGIGQWYPGSGLIDRCSLADLWPLESTRHRPTWLEGLGTKINTLLTAPISCQCCLAGIFWTVSRYHSKVLMPNWRCLRLLLVSAECNSFVWKLYKYPSWSRRTINYIPLFNIGFLKT